jgi:membrane protease YdiL (CAAX protease family)
MRHLVRAHWLWLMGGLTAACVATLANPAHAGASAWQLLVWLLLAPLLEEIVFRWGLQSWLLQRGQSAWRSNLFTATVFALAHAAVRVEWHALLVFVPALMLGAVFARGRQLVPCVGLHAAMNALWLLVNMHPLPCA